MRSVLLPVFVQVGLILGLLLWMGVRRLGAVRAGMVRREEVTLGQRNWPAAAQQASNAFSNQFELPVLFLVLVPLALATRKADLAFVVLSWAFVLSRAAHALVYATSNRIPYRLGAYTAGAVVLTVMWVLFAAAILAAPLPA